MNFRERAGAYARGGLLGSAIAMSGVGAGLGFHQFLDVNGKESACQERKPVALDQVGGELGRLDIGDLALRVTGYAESTIENNPCEMGVLIYGKSGKDPRAVTNDKSLKLVIGSRDGQFPTTIEPALAGVVSADESGFSYDVVIKATIPSGTKGFSLTALQEISDGSYQSQSIPINIQDRSTQKEP